MFYRFFAKQAHPDLEKVLEPLSAHLAVDHNKWTIKQQVGTYQQPYSYVAQGHGLTLSFYENALKEATRGQKTELVVACHNTPWLTLLARAPQQAPPTKKRLDVSPLPAQAAWQPWQLQSNNQALAQHLLGQLNQQLEIFKELEVVEWVLERQRLYIRWSWLPDTPARQEQLKATVVFARTLTQTLDELATTVSEQDA